MKFVPLGDWFSRTRLLLGYGQLEPGQAVCSQFSILGGSGAVGGVAGCALSQARRVVIDTAGVLEIAFLNFVTYPNVTSSY